MADYAISPEFLKSYRDWQNQRQATTGISPRPEDFQALAEANLNVQASNKYRDRAQQMQQQSLDMQKEQISKQDRAATISGITGIGTSAALTYGVGKSLGWWGAKEAAATGVSEATTAGFGTIEAGGAALPVAAPATEGALATAGGYAMTALPAVGALALGSLYSKVTGERNPLTQATHFLSRVGDGLIKAVTGNTIICTELYRQGLITQRQRRYGLMFGHQVGEEVYQGYIVAAEPIVTRMQRSRLFTMFVAFFAIPAIAEMSHRVHPRNKGSIFGSLVLHFGIKHCVKVYDGLPEEANDGCAC